jgi:uncharacterized protein
MHGPVFPKGVKYVPHPNEVMYRNAQDAALKGDMEPELSILDPMVVVHVPGRGPLSGEVRGVDAVLEWLGKLAKATEGTWRTENLEIVANEDVAFKRSSYRAKRGQRSIKGQFVEVNRIRKGKIVEIWLFFGNQYAFDEFCS